MPVQKAELHEGSAFCLVATGRLHGLPNIGTLVSSWKVTSTGKSERDRHSANAC